MRITTTGQGNNRKHVVKLNKREAKVWTSAGADAYLARAEIETAARESIGPTDFEIVFVKGATS